MEELYQLYRSRLMCSVCNVNPKNTVMLRCLHVFCEYAGRRVLAAGRVRVAAMRAHLAHLARTRSDCVRTRYDTRQRKCPICGEGFGKTDYKLFYL
jgi:E3 ubiquitin-protein ligase BRE1